MPDPTAGSLHVDSALTNISVAFLQNAANFVAAQVFPNVPVQKQSDRYFTYDRGDFNRDEAEKRGPGTESAGSGFKLDNTPTYFCDVWAHHKDVADQIRANADSAVQIDRATTEFVTHKLLIKREKEFVTNYFTSGLWTTDITGVASGPTGNQALHWSDAASTPIEDIRAAKTVVLESTAYEPNTLVIGKHVYDALADHPDIVDRIKYSGGIGNENPARVSLSNLAQLFEVERILISKAIENTAEDGATNVHSFIAGKHALLCYSAPSPDLMVPSAGYTFSWTGFMGTANNMGMAMKRFRMDHLESERIEGQMAWDMKLVAADLGYFWDGIVA